MRLGVSGVSNQPPVQWEASLLCVTVPWSIYCTGWITASYSELLSWVYRLIFFHVSMKGDHAQRRSTFPICVHCTLDREAPVRSLCDQHCAVGGDMTALSTGRYWMPCIAPNLLKVGLGRECATKLTIVDTWHPVSSSRDLRRTSRIPHHGFASMIGMVSLKQGTTGKWQDNQVFSSSLQNK